ncbi:hypothetical protein [Mycobacterium sp. D16R24]|uniref:hypothetical protein n=1 Tax=Mycobacterium sp. D16R24 TaxID=1855656 RepID=UPI001117073B|nr:hypothetical protein [Mycobacterium sp. D16R24]
MAGTAHEVAVVAAIAAFGFGVDQAASSALPFAPGAEQVSFQIVLVDAVALAFAAALVEDVDAEGQLVLGNQLMFGAEPEDTDREEQANRFQHKQNRCQYPESAGMVDGIAPRTREHAGRESKPSDDKHARGHRCKGVDHPLVEGSAAGKPLARYQDNVAPSGRFVRLHHGGTLWRPIDRSAMRLDPPDPRRAFLSDTVCHF